MSKTAYRENKQQIYGCYLTDEESEIVLAAIEKAAQKTGVNNNRKNRLSLIELAKHYIETA
ncbi:hypothetical protein PVK62_08295 [Aliivibrio sp. S3MY1]|uniref:hypothetical protein n=1 Tax=Aliivibrio sp. S3MY1 TaxID=3028424 RepID=UPI00237900E9|nr:hypothetical protein [Aliivibrio sp. S3MY1]MDD9195840.1 hypothetical protein [Aliivibrio sp. S3MY1]